MSFRTQGMTGSNNIPLGNRRRFGGGAGSVGDDSSNSTPIDTYIKAEPYIKSEPSPPEDLKRGRTEVKAEYDENGVKKRKKRNRWGDAQENKAAGLMGLPTMIMANMTNEQLEAYTLHLRIEEISQKLRINDVVPADGDRSPSPAPQYDNFGRRVNTREFRYRKRLEDERHKLVEKAMKVIPNYHPPSDYRRPTKTQEKVYVPVNDYPEINFIGLLIGPRGNTLKTMEKDSGAKIAIRGKGSVKEGKGRSDAAHTSNQEEDLHCLIMADTEEKVNKAKKLIHNVIETAASIPEGQNELKRNQLRELATLNGTLRDDENQACQNCGQIGHRKYDCPEQRNFTANIICRVCGNAGHMARDCPDRQRGTNWRNDAPGGFSGARAPPGRAIGPGDAVDREYEQLMQELSGGAPSGDGQAPQRIEAGPGGYSDQRDGYGGARDGGYGGDRSAGGERDARPWHRGPTGAPAPWQNRGGRDDRDRHQDYHHRDVGSGSGNAPPWANRGGGGGGGNGGGGRGGGGGDGYGYDQGGYGGQGGGPPVAPWHQQQQQQQQQQQGPPPAVAPPVAAGVAYPGASYPGYEVYQAMGAPPGLGAAAGLGAPPGLAGMFQAYAAAAGIPGMTAVPPPPGGSPPPPPPGGAPPPIDQTGGMKRLIDTDYHKVGWYMDSDENQIEIEWEEKET
ncbi:MAG: Histone acetyltransferase [Watsoniomyces obsoletus]|nr:MAG: Histone acetyltransferase [Watsoniomyces obsoletus]